MSKIKLLLDVVSDLRSLADSLQAVAGAMTQDEPMETPVTKPEKKTKKAEAEPAPEPIPEEKPLTLEEVRAVLAEKSRAGTQQKSRHYLSSTVRISCRILTRQNTHRSCQMRRCCDGKTRTIVGILQSQVAELSSLRTAV